MKKLKMILVGLVLFTFSSCILFYSSKPKDLEPIINGQFKDAQKVFYPSTDFKVSAIVVDKNGDVWYLRMNGEAEMKDNVKLFNVSEFQK